MDVSLKVKTKREKPYKVNVATALPPTMEAPSTHTSLNESLWMSSYDRNNKQKVSVNRLTSWVFYFQVNSRVLVVLFCCTHSSSTTQRSIWRRPDTSHVWNIPPKKHNEEIEICFDSTVSFWGFKKRRTSTCARAHPPSQFFCTKICHILGAHSSSLRTHEQKWNLVRNFIFRENKPTERWCWLSVVPERQKWDAFLIRASHADTAGQPHVVSEPPISSTCPHRKTNIYKEMELTETTSSCRRFILCLGLRFFLNKTKTL